MKTIKIGFASNCNIDRYVTELLKKKFNVEVSNNNCDYFICNELIYSDANAFNELLNLKPEVIRIIFCGEALYPDLNLFDYAVGWDEFDHEERTIKFPSFALRIGSIYDSISEIDLSKKNKNPLEILKEKTKFCNFIYSNPLAHPTRDNLFYKLSEYKKVDSLGKHLKNIEIEDTRNDNNWGKISIDLKRPYKFSIAAENVVFKGCTTEKILTSMLANTIPIYFGNPDIKEEFNPKSFINVSDFNNLDEVVERIKEIDQNDELYCEIMSEPYRTPEQIEKKDKELSNFYNKFYYIFEQNFKEAHRRPQGCWPDYYYLNIFKRALSQYIYIYQKRKRISFYAEKIFSVKNDKLKRHNIINLLGIKFKL